MEIETELNDMFSYSFLPVLFTTILLVIIVILINTKKKPIKKVIYIPSTNDLISIKNKYLVNLDLIMNDYRCEKITERVAYQRLSSLIRNFIFETTHIEVQKYTLKEIATVNMPVLYELVKEYYDPEFAKDSNGNFIDSFHKTKAVIERWR